MLPLFFSSFNVSHNVWLYLAELMGVALTLKSVDVIDAAIVAVRVGGGSPVIYFD